ncbi:hypothetical protein A2524_00620 [Candidatus Wolfebacteria bacterium RIFOXYD12_FULL_48_21]|uniref:Glycosyltransferase 2-like domain-containing protein n=1 Tax=Candidatus Wolfebacteria bacterium RIFOXYD1_FULL_48_65 TaxID=1802561 RepID=A0A1F8E0G3_9BACT|nr:MAG: hypothetical protein A2610_00315 [Candidatus Wolfebacteria bacterium RIFOXYD1_FULL_48_65]OGM94319.1 MAG: hypothetical protein A2524_00620 [Candidatus Wolfebacteria bacterium RIFOXYD12_FULL_48_21]OGM95883.1 MAG: hypothetical protein A2532_02450 [Candidatus Wolfebacteria bacterium RIFOXYD2_FULL_48_11]
MNKTPLISVIMPVYNAERFVKEAIESILHQTFTDFEFIIINDGSSDRSAEIIKSFTDPRIHMVSQSNTGIIGALNTGLKIAQGTYIARMDADDMSEPVRLEKQVTFLRGHPDIALCGTWAKTISDTGEETGAYDYPSTTHAEIKRAMLRHNPFIHPSVMFTKQAIEKVGRYRQEYKHAEDYELWTRIVATFNTANLPEYLFKYRITEGSVTQKHWGPMIRKTIIIRILAFMRIWLKIPI